MLEDLLALPIGLERHSEDPKARAMLQLALARAHGLTSYDAAYLDLALQARLPLASLDSRLMARAGIAGVPGLPQEGAWGVPPPLGEEITLPASSTSEPSSPGAEDS